MIPPEWLVRQALDLAREAAFSGEIPVGSIIYTYNPDARDECEVLARARNRILEDKDPTAHAEILALRDSSRHLNSERILNAFLISTLEPCVMCAGALIFSRINSVYYLAPRLKEPGMTDILNITLPEKRWNHHPNMIHLTEYMDESVSLLQEFFVRRRRENKERRSD